MKNDIITLNYLYQVTVFSYLTLYVLMSQVVKLALSGNIMDHSENSNLSYGKLKAAATSFYHAMRTGTAVGLTSTSTST